MQGISVYQRDGRPHWYVAYTCPHRGRRVNESTGFKVSDPRSKLEAYAYARDKAQSGVAVAPRSRDPSAWGLWVVPWLKDRYAHQPKSLTNHLGAWKQLSFFLVENKIPVPRLLRYEHVVAFVHWREQQVKQQSGRTVSRNTALLNVRSLSRIMREAVRRGYAQGNPCKGITEDVPAIDPKEKPEFTDEQIALVRAELARRSGLGRPSDWMAIAFEIALHQGCRLSATQIPLRDVDLQRGTIRLQEKGDKDFTMPIHPALRPLLQRLKDTPGREFTCVLPRFASRNFSRVMRAIGLPHSFHSTRVSVITRMARNDVPEQKAMRYVQHGSWAVHQIYTRLKAHDVAGVAGALGLPPPPASVGVPAPGSPRSPGDHPATSKPSPGSSSGR